MKTVSFFHDMVSGDFQSSRTRGLDHQAEAIGKAINAHIGYEDAFVPRLAGVLAYTRDLRFTWVDGVPDEIRALETFWKDYKAGVDVGRCYVYFSEHVDTLVFTGQEADFEMERLTDDDLKALDAVKVVVGNRGSLFKRVDTAAKVVGWEGAALEALKAWEPPTAWKLRRELTESEREDPLLSRNDSASDTST